MPPTEFRQRFGVDTSNPDAAIFISLLALFSRSDFNF